jgi:hypothetical protein
MSSSGARVDLAMSDTDRPRSPFTGMADFSIRPPVRMLSRDEIEQVLAAHRLYLEDGMAPGPPRELRIGRSLRPRFLRGSICAGSRWTAPSSAAQTSQALSC